MKYSVLMSVYKKEKATYFKESIQSMLNQTIMPDEFVIVKDGEITEELEEVIAKYSSEYKNLFKIIDIKENVGLGPALAIGIDNCKNEYIARMDSDDISIPTRIEKQMKKLEEFPDIDIIGSNVGEFIDNTENIISYRNLPESNDDIQKFSKKRNPFAHPSVILRKQKVLEAGNYRKYYLCEDYDLWNRMIAKGAKCYNIQENLVFMRISKDFFKRRGGIKYLKSILKFKVEQYRNGYYSLKNLIISGGSHIIVCLLPNFIREFVYLKLLRSKS